MFRSTFVAIGATVFAATIALSDLDAQAVTLTDTVIVDGAPVGYQFLTLDGKQTYEIGFETDGPVGSIGGSGVGSSFFNLVLSASDNIVFDGISLFDGGKTYIPVTNPELPTSSTVLFSADVAGSTSTSWVLSLSVIDNEFNPSVFDFVSGHIAASSVLNTPLPASAWLFVTALGLVGGANWRRRN